MEEESKDPKYQRIPDNSSKSLNLDEEVVKDFLAIQKQEIAIRQNEIILRGKEVDNQKEIALRQLQAQEGDLRDQRAHNRSSSLITKGFIVLLIIFVLGLIVYLIEKGRDALALEIIKILGTAIISFGGGFFYGKSRARETNIETPDD